MKKLVCISLMLIAHQTNAMDAQTEAHKQDLKKAKEVQEIQILEDLEKALGHYNALRDIILARVAAGQEVPEKRIIQLRLDLHDVSGKVLRYVNIKENHERDLELLRDIDKGIESGNELLAVLENPASSKQLSMHLKGLIQSN